MSDQIKSGLNINLGNNCSRIAFGWAKKTFPNRKNLPGQIVLKTDGAFSNLLSFKDQKIGIASDGIGTKIELAERTGIYNTLGYDLIAMVADDLITSGIVPTNISNILDVDYLDERVVDELMEGLYAAANTAGIAITGGEIAELGNRINGFGGKMHFNWCSTAIGILNPNLVSPIDGTNVKEGQIIVAIQSKGFRSNGFSMIRKIMMENFGENWHEEPYNDYLNWGEVLLTPSYIYTPLIRRLINHNTKIKGIAHITGGGIADNLNRILKLNHKGAVLDNLFEPLESMKKLQKLGNLSQEEAYLYWNMGNGMFLIIEEEDWDDLNATAKKMSYNAKRVGFVIKEKIIKLNTSEKTLTYYSN